MNEPFISSEGKAMQDMRLEKIYLEAGRLFNHKGYANTKVSEIAVAAGVATGTMYNLFTGKEAILSFIIQATLDKTWIKQDISLPMKQIDVTILKNSLQKVVNETFDTVMVIKDKKGKLCKDFPILISEIFDLFADYLLAFDNIERNTEVLEKLYEEYYPAKMRFYELLEEHLKCYMEVGQIRQIEYLPLHIQSLIDTLTWWALNSYISTQMKVPREIAKQIGVEIVVRAYSI